MEPKKRSVFGLIIDHSKQKKQAQETTNIDK